MALTVATNTGALMAQAAASSVNKQMETSMERLSTGKRINAASDDAAGVAIASRLSAEIKGTNQSIRNAMDGQALIDTAEGAHKEVENILQRMREVAVQAANDTNSAADRTAMATEMSQLTEEINRIAATTTWAGVNLLAGAKTDGTIAATPDQVKNFKFQISSNDYAGQNSDQLSVNIKAIDATSLGISGSTEADVVDVAKTGSTTFVEAGTTTKTLTVGSWKTGETLSFNINGNAVSVSTTSAAATTTNRAYAGDADGVAYKIIDELNALGMSGVTATRTATGVVTIVQTGAVAIDTNANAELAMGAIDAAITELNTQRANLGSYSNRLDSTISNLTNVSNNLQAGKGRIEDADFAAETTNLAKAQILQQASTAMLAQANAAKQNVLSLLQG